MDYFYLHEKGKDFVIWFLGYELTVLLVVYCNDVDG